MRPRDGVADANARWLRGRPEFEVLGAVVVSNAVSVMNGLTVAQVPSEQILCHEDVLEDIRPTRGTRVTGRTRHDVPGFVPSTTTSPIAVRLS